MRLLFYLGHPAHFHLFKNPITWFKANGHEVHILIKKKDILEDLLDDAGLKYINIFPKTRGMSKISMTTTILKRNFKLFNYCRKHRPQLLIGTSVENSHIGKLMGIPSINVNEDDHDVVPLYSHLSYPLANTILSPVSCSNGSWEHKSVHYRGYHELSYLHPEHFRPDSRIAARYVPVDKPYFLIRFAKLNAHHDKGIRGINTELAQELVNRLSRYGHVFITSEKKLEDSLESYRMKIDPLDMHHVMAFADLYIGDSQTMAAESAVLGTPFIRYNDFVGRIGYLRELEDDYNLGFGISPDHPARLFETVDRLLSDQNLRAKYMKNRQRMLREKIDVNRFLIWFISNFPASRQIMKTNPSFQMKFCHAMADEPLIWKTHESLKSNIPPKLVSLKQA